HSFDCRFNLIVVIPAIDELKSTKILIESLQNQKINSDFNALILFVVNNHDNHSEEIKNSNHELINYIDSFKTNLNLSSSSDRKVRLSYIDASSKGKTLPQKDAGVGLARKIGMDLALSQFDFSANKQILVCLDADCTVSPTYFEEIYKYFLANDCHAASIRFEHPLVGTDEENKAIVNYEIFLRYYVLGLKFASSPFAFFTIGSSMACSAEAYTKIGGMNKKKAAEDFYFLEKLSKNYKVHEISNCAVYPSSRGSWRVPFGTGQRVNRFLKYERNEYLLYNPNSFEILKQWLQIFMAGDVKSENEYLESAKSISPVLYEYLVANNFAGEWKRILDNSKGVNQIQKQKSLWFDGFKTLKFVHYLRDNGFQQVGMF
ncbi:MAG TPA: glycosyltransferase, partial [Ignavibacteriaceae bacterium]|nr:glycosyltransferase [Ignavibacteriaceae bacterium]